MKMIMNRDGIIVIPKMEFYEYINAVEDEGIDAEDFMAMRTVYLVEMTEENTPENVEKMLARVCPQIITAEITGWYEDEDLIPKKLDFDLFNKWFEWEYTETICDTLENEIETESLD
ncbi:MAG TPA: hypothetical protein VF857_04715, partial [Spirochaetota bacterium]